MTHTCEIRKLVSKQTSTQIYVGLTYVCVMKFLRYKIVSTRVGEVRTNTYILNSLYLTVFY